MVKRSEGLKYSSFTGDRVQRGFNDKLILNCNCSNEIAKIRKFKDPKGIICSLNQFPMFLGVRVAKFEDLRFVLFSLSERRFDNGGYRTA